MTTAHLDRFVEFADFEAYARETLPPAAFDHLAAGAGANWTRDENRRAYDRWVIRKRLMADVADTDLSVTVLGDRIDLPIMLAPSAFHKFAHPDGEHGSAGAAAKMGTAQTLSTLSSVPLEAVSAYGHPCWLQLQIHKDRGLTTSLSERAEAAGYKALCLTVDAPNYGVRPADKRNHLRLPKEVKIANLEDRFDLPSHVTGEDLMAYLWKEMAQDVTWDDARWLVDKSGIPVVAKGVMSGPEARNAVAAGCVGVIVSNQGGRQIDGEAATLDVLSDEVEVYVDRGVRQGSHVFKALALGARAVLLGRPIYWGLAAGGQAGVVKMLENLRQELENTMQLAGAKRAADITRELVSPFPPS